VVEHAGESFELTIGAPPLGGEAPEVFCDALQRRGVRLQTGPT
jgi:hypothetical protein